MASEHHISHQFDAELEAIKSRVLAMGGIVERQIEDAVVAIIDADSQRAEEVVAREKQVNGLEVAVDDEATKILVKRQPAASDLRLVLIITKAVRDLERIGDEAKKIAKAARRLHSAETPFVPRVGLTQAVELALELLRASLDAFARVNPEGIEDLRRKDAEIDAGFKGVMRQLITYMMEDPRTISSCLEMLFIAKAIERVGDHAMNIAEHVVFVARGEDVRFEKSQAQLGRG